MQDEGALVTLVYFNSKLPLPVCLVPLVFAAILQRQNQPQMASSSQTPYTRACSLRFVNKSSNTVDVLWLNYEGTEQKYATVAPQSQHVQATFTTHPWVIKDSERTLSRYMGDTAVIEILSDGSCKVHKGKAKHIGPTPRPTPAHWGSYRSRGQVRGVTIMAFDCVLENAINAAADCLQYMLHSTPASICQRLADNDADIAIIGRDQVVSDMPPHGHLRGQSCAVGDRTFDHGTRGVGGNLACPTCSVGEENVTMLNDKHYGQENILIHEFAHSVMCIGMDDEQRHSVCAAFQEAQQSGSYQRHIYMMENADEYWAEATQSWFDATIRTDVNDGINTREKVKDDPLLATLLMNAYGDGPWRYTHTMPRDWGGKPRSSPVQHYHQQQYQQMHSTDARFQQPQPQLQLQLAPVHHKRRRRSRFCCFPFLSAISSKLQ